ncbi:MAG: AAA family ATPase [Myxococcota bacterium]
MRIDELGLDAFGPFSDRRLVLCEGGGEAGDAGLCLVYGPNEAGKSSALRAIRGLFYGIDHDSRDNFVHAHADLRVAARLRFQDGFTARLVRRKGRKQTLTGEGEPGEEAVRRLTALTQAIPEALFRHLYGLDHPALVEGSAQLLEDGGELSRALFGAGLGIVHLRKLIDDLEAEAAALFKPRGSNQRIAISLAEWKEIQVRIRDETLDPGRFEEQARRTRALEVRFRELDDALAGIQVELARVRRRRDAGLALVQAEQAREQVRARIEREIAREAALVLDPGLLADREPIEDLHQRLESYREARDQLPRREEPAERLGEVARSRRCSGSELGGASEAVLRRIAARTARVRALVADSARSLDRLEEAKEAEREARRELERLDALALREGEEAAQADADPVPLEQAQRRAQRLGPIDEEIEEAERGLAALEGDAARMRERLGLGGISDAVLEALAIPSRVVIEGHARRQATHRDEVARRHQAREALAEERRAVGEELGRLRGEGGLPSEAELAAERARRDAQWRGLRARLLDVSGPAAPGPDAAEAAADFESTMHGADRLADRLRSEASRVARGAEPAPARSVSRRRSTSRIGRLPGSRSRGRSSRRIARRMAPRRSARAGRRRGGSPGAARSTAARARRAPPCPRRSPRASGRGATRGGGASRRARAGGSAVRRGRAALALARAGGARACPSARAATAAARRGPGPKPGGAADRARGQGAPAVGGPARARRGRVAGRARRAALPEATRPEQAGAWPDAIGGLLERRREVDAPRRRVELMRELVARFEAQCAALVARHRPGIAELAPEVAALRLKRELDHAGAQATSRGDRDGARGRAP